MSMHDDPHYLDSALKAGAAGHILKGCSVSELVAATVDGAAATVPAFEAAIPEPASAGLLCLTALMLGRRSAKI